MTWRIARLRAIFRQDAYPYERRVLLWGKVFEHAFMSAAVAGWTAFAVFGWPSWLGGVRPADMSTWGGWLWFAAGHLWTAFGAWGASAAVSFWWADWGPEERWREFWLGAAMIPKIAPNHTWEDYAGFARGGYPEDTELEAAWNRDKFDARQDPLWMGQPGSGRYDDLSPVDWTWAVGFHHRWVRPWALARKSAVGSFFSGIPRTGWVIR